MKALKTKDKTRPAEPEQESMTGCCIESAFRRFIEASKGMGRSPQTLERHHTSYRLLCRYFEDSGGDTGITGGGTAAKIKLSAITPQIMAGFQTWLYQAISRYKKPYSLKTQIIILNSLQVFFKHLHNSGIIFSNPAEVIQLPREPKKLPGIILTTKEMKKLLKQPDTSTVLGFRDRTIYEVLYSTGLRISEMIWLRVQDLNLSESSLFIKESKHFKDRYVPLGKTAGSYLVEYFNNVRPLLIKKQGEPTAFLSRLGRTLDDGGVQHKLQIYGQRAGIEKHLTVHVFRHTLATEMLRHGADLRQIQELLGHKNLRTTQIYTHIVKGELKRIQAHCHPREQTDLPENYTHYRGRQYLTDEEKKLK